MKEKNLYLVPLPISEIGIREISPYSKEIINSLDLIICERVRTARRFISALKPGRPVSEMNFEELDKHNPQDILQELSRIFIENTNIGLMSEAGCPAVADPGNIVVKWCHQNKVKVIPLSGPSSIMMALMASGLDGQSFGFNGYLSAKKDQLKKDILLLEKKSHEYKSSESFIETPYRNQQMYEGLISTLQSKTQLSISSNLGEVDQFVKTQKVSEWKKDPSPNLQKNPTVFVIQSFD